MPEFPPDSIGGGGIVFEALAREFAVNHDVAVITGSFRRPTPRQGEISVTAVPEVPLPHRLRFLATTMPPTPWGAITLWRRIRGADVVHAHGFGFPVVDLGVRIARWRHIPVLHTLHGFPVSQTMRGRLVRLAFWFYERLCGRPALRRAAAHSAVSASVAEFYRSRFDIEASIVPNGVELATAEPWPDLANIQKRGGHMIVCVGRLEWIKGFDTVVRAVPILDEKSRPQVVFIGADHGAKRDLETLAKRLGVDSFCHFVGLQTRGRVTAAYQAATVCVVASHTEAFPAVPLEAMAAGVPLVSTRLPGISSYAVDGKNCDMFCPGDPADLADVLRRILLDEGLRQERILAGRGASARYTWPTVADQYEQLFVSVIGRSTV